MEPILQVRDLRTSFLTSNGEVHAVRGVSFDVEKGKTLGIVGESGSGKSVTSLSILTLLGTTGRVTAGSIKLDGEELTGKIDGELPLLLKLRAGFGNIINFIAVDRGVFAKVLFHGPRFLVGTV